MLQHSGVTDIFVATRYMGGKIQRVLGDGSRYGLNLQYVEEDRPLGTCGPVLTVKDELLSPFLLINSDIVTELDFRRFYEDAIRMKASLTLGTVHTSLACRYGVISADETGVVKSFVEKPSLSVEILGGIYCLDPVVLQFVEAGVQFGIDNLIMALFKAHFPVRHRVISDLWIDVGEISDYQRAVTLFDDDHSAVPAKQQIPSDLARSSLR
jgi:mannose-1-phosphate guanylyltransferase